MTASPGRDSTPVVEWTWNRSAMNSYDWEALDVILEPFIESISDE